MPRPAKKIDARNVIGPRVREARRSLVPPLTQDQLSGKLANLGIQLDRVALAKLESGRRCAFDFEVKALAATLGVTVAWLLFEPDHAVSRSQKKPKRPK
jgi:hypothetical protein